MPQHSQPAETNRSGGGGVFGPGVLLVGALAVVAIGVGVGSAPAAGLFPINNFTAIDDPVAINPSGQNVVVTGTTQCTEGEIVEVEVRVQQGDVEATGQTRERCLGEDTVQRWRIHAATHGPASFEPGDGHVWAEARTYARGRMIDEHTWDSAVAVVRR